MTTININHGLKTENWVSALGHMFNGCSGYSYSLSPSSRHNRSSFDRPLQLNVWDLLLNGIGEYGAGKPGSNKRLKVLYRDPRVRLPSPKAHFRPPPDFAAYYLKSGDDVLAILGTAAPEHFNHPDTPPALFMSDPEKYVSLAHLEAAGMYNRKRVYPYKKQPDLSKVAVCGESQQLRLEGRTQWNARAIAQAHNLATEWSQELTWMLELPWWELCRLAGTRYPSSDEIVQGVADYVSKRQSPARYLWNVSGNANVRGPLDSFRAVFCFHAANPAATFDLEATPSITSSDGKGVVYYKVLPFYYHSPQHADHRVATVFLSKDPIHLERIS